jgi:hypothetical protein
MAKTVEDYRLEQETVRNSMKDRCEGMIIVPFCAFMYVMSVQTPTCA